MQVRVVYQHRCPRGMCPVDGQTVLVIEPTIDVDSSAYLAPRDVMCAYTHVGLWRVTEPQVEPVAV